MWALGSSDYTPSDIVDALKDIISCHPSHPLPTIPVEHIIPPPITIDEHTVSCPFHVAPWMVGAPLIALKKKSGGFRPIAIGEVICHLASGLCCKAVHSFYQISFFHIIRWELVFEVALKLLFIQVNRFLEAHSLEEDMCCVKNDMRNAFINKKLPELEKPGFVVVTHALVNFISVVIGRIFSWCSARRSSRATLFSLVVLELVNKIGQIDGIALSVWCLDDGTFIGKRSAILSFLDKLISIGPDLGLHLNLCKHEIFWPTGDQNFPEFPAEFSLVLLNKGGVDLLVSPIFGSDAFF